MSSREIEEFFSPTPTSASRKGNFVFVSWLLSLGVNPWADIYMSVPYLSTQRRTCNRTRICICEEQTKNQINTSVKNAIIKVWIWSKKNVENEPACHVVAAINSFDRSVTHSAFFQSMPLSHILKLCMIRYLISLRFSEFITCYVLVPFKVAVYA